MPEHAITIWSPSDTVIIPTAATTADAIVEYGRATLSKRDVNAIVSGFQAGGYEMVSTFVWTKAAATLKKQVATLGMEFVGEMLRRPDLNEDSDPATSIGDHEAIGLAEDLGMITPTQGLRLKQALQLVNHFANLDQPEADQEQMHLEDAVAVLRTCITSVLGKPKFEAAIQFADFRKALGERTLKPDDGDVAVVMGSPYFFIRTTLSALLAMIKGAQGAQLEHAVGNSSLLIPMFWQRLREPERWQIGQAYAEVIAAGNRISAAGLKRTLLDVHGFDFVPESLRSNTFTESAARVLSAHFALNNFYNEKEPMQVLANLGTSIPMPAFAKCMEATLAVWLGNYYGHSWAAESYATTVLKGLRKAQWEYYFNQCLPSDRTILDKLCGESKPTTRWRTLLGQLLPGDLTFRLRAVGELVEASLKPTQSHEQVHAKANILRASATAGN